MPLLLTEVGDNLIIVKMLIIDDKTFYKTQILILKFTFFAK